MEHTSAFTSIIDSQLLPMRVGIVFLMGCCILAAYCRDRPQGYFHPPSRPAGR